MKLLVLAEVFPPRRGGSGQWLWEIYRRLTVAESHVVTANVNAVNFDRTAGLKISRIPFNFSSWGVSTFKSAFQYLETVARTFAIAREFKPEAMHCGKTLPEGLVGVLIGWLRRIPVVVYVHGEELTLAAEGRELERLTRFVLHRAYRVIANSEHTKNLLVDRWGLNVERIRVLHPGVDTTRFMPAPKNAETRRRLGWHDRRVILTVGALQRRKGQDMVIRALSAVRRQCPDVLYSIAGEGWERKYLEDLARECGVHDIVQFRDAPGNQELLDCYQQCDVFVLANRQVGWDFEGFGIVLLEAQACGKPVVAGTSGGTGETMKNGDTGELIPCEEPDKLSAVISALLEDSPRRKAMGTRGRQWAVEHFDSRVVAQAAASALVFQ